MTSRKSVFVIGAGASCELNFPSGEALVDQISKMARVVFNPNDGIETPLHQNFYSVAYRVLANRFSGRVQSGLLRDRMLKLSEGVVLSYSIDDYLARHEDDKELILLGKLAIAYLIAECEQKSSLYVPQIKRDYRPRPLPTSEWFGRFFKALTSQCTFTQLPERLRDLCVICFNYDRNIEQFLIRAIAALYSVDESTAASTLSHLTIWHPYGSLGGLPGPTNQQGLRYGPELRPGFEAEVLSSMAEGLRTFSEGVETLDDPLVAQVRSHLKVAARFVFLGFGYLPANMTILRILLHEARLKTSPLPIVIGTCFGVLDYDRDQYREELKNLFSTLPGQVLLGGRETKCADLFVEYSRALRFP